MPNWKQSLLKAETIKIKHLLALLLLVIIIIIDLFSISFLGTIKLLWVDFKFDVGGPYLICLVRRKASTSFSPRLSSLLFV